MAPGVGFEPTRPVRATGSQGLRLADESALLDPHRRVNPLSQRDASPNGPALSRQYPPQVRLVPVIKRHNKWLSRRGREPLNENSPAGYRTLDHVTDALIEAWAPTFEEALVQAALGLFDTMVDTGNSRPALEEELSVEGHDELELVYNWLEQLLLSFEIKQQV